jgi:light-regulated signal transduction histidine kinase (bacteriophytochrome)
VHPDDIAAVQEAFLEVLAGVRDVDRPIVARVQAADGSWHSLEMMAANLLDDPNVQGIVVNSRDVTDRVEMERSLRSMAHELERSNTELEQFAIVASHDLQEPLRTLSGFAQLLQRRHGEQLDPEGRDFVGYILTSAARMQSLIDDLLEYSRVGQTELRLETIDSNELMEEVARSLDGAILDAGANVVVHALPSVQGDRHLLERLFLNLISNAIKFRRGEHPRIEVFGVSSDDKWTFSVVDDGIGVDPSKVERIFDVFTRLLPRDRYDGTGMGLAICHRIAERHGGRIWVESRPEGGSIFCFTLPIPRTAART